MNNAHWHLIVNHFPIIGTIFGLGILIAGMVMKNKTVINTAYAVFVVAALFGFASMYTGEGAEEMVEDLPSVGERVIHEHEEMAEKLAVLLYALGGLSLVGLWLHFKQNASMAKWITYVALLLGIGAALLAKEVGTTGGEVRHTEIRTDGSGTSGLPAPESGEEDD